MKKKLKVNILTTGRFHVLDLARELDAQGIDVAFYSFVPLKRCLKFGLKKDCCHSLLIPLLLFIFLERKLFRKGKIRELSFHIRRFVQDHLTAWIMRKADVVIAMSGEYVYALKIARKRGMKVILERGAMHIITQRKILESVPSLRNTIPVPDDMQNRELQGYDIANYVSIPATHVRKSFIDNGYPENKLFLNAYGVDLSQFGVLQNVEKKYDVIMTGNFSYQKGCDLLIEACRICGYSLLHVGEIYDIDFPKDSSFTHVDAVDQIELVKYYNQAKIFCMPSRQEGFGMVFLQAIVCNLPIVGSQNSGAPDLRNMIKDNKYIQIFVDYTPESVADSLKNAMKLYEQMGNVYHYAEDSIENLSWKQYGKRYADFLHKITMM